jgi:hypothetical protein
MEWTSYLLRHRCGKGGRHVHWEWSTRRCSIGSRCSVKANSRGLTARPKSVPSIWRSVGCEPDWRARRWSATFWEKRRRTSQMDRLEVRLYPAPPQRLPYLGAVPGAGREHSRVPRALRSFGQRCPAPPSEPRWPLKVLHLWPVKLLHPGLRKLMH